jgi:hypothetical protein
MAMTAINRNGSLIYTPVQIAGPHLQCCPVLSLDEPVALQGNHPLRVWALVPISDPTDWENQERHVLESSWYVSHRGGSCLPTHRTDHEIGEFSLHERAHTRRIGHESVIGENGSRRSLPKIGHRRAFTDPRTAERPSQRCSRW